jgi:hypothetical protein
LMQKVHSAAVESEPDLWRESVNNESASEICVAIS